MNINWVKVAEDLEGKARTIRELADLSQYPHPLEERVRNARITHSILAGLADAIRKGLDNEMPE